jgi:double-stranded uracil-DNA glycosylase
MPEPRLKYGLAPVFRPDARVLILGSLPGEASLAANQYYAHPGNHFWRLMEKTIGHDLVALSYTERLDCLCDHHIALWDMVSVGTRRGSLDQTLRASSLQQIPQLARKLAGLRLIAFNGAKAGALGIALADISHIAKIQLPSSSAANTAQLDEKLRHWSRIADFL